MTKTSIEGMSDCMSELVLCCLICNGSVFSRNSYGIRGCISRTSMYYSIGLDVQGIVRQRAFRNFCVILQCLVKLHICFAVDGVEVDGAKIDITTVRSLASLSPTEYFQVVYYLQLAIASRVTVTHFDIRIGFSAETITPRSQNLEFPIYICCCLAHFIVKQQVGVHELNMDKWHWFTIACYPTRCPDWPIFRREKPTSNTGVKENARQKQLHEANHFQQSRWNVKISV